MRFLRKGPRRPYETRHVGLNVVDWTGVVGTVPQAGTQRSQSGFPDEYDTSAAFPSCLSKTRLVTLL
jgi:hypothetical protein